MLDLKSKLASAGLVSQQDVERIEKEKARERAKPKASKARRKPADDSTGLPVAQLRSKPKGEVYAVVRGWIEKVRVDRPDVLPSDDAKTFHFPEHDGRIGRLMLEPEIGEQLQRGKAGVVTYMSNHGLAHAVVPAACARAVADLYPHWLRVLEGDARAGEIEAKTAKDGSPS
jgi:hypothetical protein